MYFGGLSLIVPHVRLNLVIYELKLYVLLLIINYLKSANTNRLLFIPQESMKSDSEVVKVTTVPFLLELASRSDMLLQVLSTDLIKSCKQFLIVNYS